MDPPEPPSRRVQRPTDPRMLELLVCPVSHTALQFDAARHELVSRAAGLAFPIRDGIPILLVSEARPLGDDER